MNTAKTAFVFGIALAVSACGTQNRGLESVHQPVVQRTDYVFDVNTNGGSLPSYEATRLTGWFNSLKLGYGDRVAVDGAGTYESEAARNAVAAVAARYGLLLDRAAPITAGEIAPGSVRVVVSRLKATVPNCPDWSSPSQPNFGANAMSNFGCSTNTNLAGMVANPADLIQGQDGGAVSSTDAASKAIKSYRDKAPTGEAGLAKEKTGEGE